MARLGAMLLEITAAGGITALDEMPGRGQR